MKIKITLNDFIFFLLGFSSIAAQIIFMREFLALFYGNEISLGIFLANWLFWTSLGSFVAGKISAFHHYSYSSLAFLQTGMGVLLPLMLLAIRCSPFIWQTMPGESLGPFPIFMISFTALAPFCLLSGALFTAAARVYSHSRDISIGRSASRVYIVETFGSAAGGIVLSLLFLCAIQPMVIVLLTSIINFFTARFLFLQAGFVKRKVLFNLLFAVALLLILISTQYIDILLIAKQWPEFKVSERRYSRYGQLLVVQHEESKTLYENGTPLFTVPNQEAAEEAVHYALLLHPQPKSLLLIGGGLSGSAIEALKHPSIQSIDYVELDPALMDLARKNFTEIWLDLQTDPRIRIHHRDGRLFLKQSGQKYDLILIQLPDPRTAQLNRFYTVEFFRLCAQKLNPQGILSFQISASENYISDALAEFLKCLHHTVKQAFAYSSILPGQSAHFFASNYPNVVDLNADTLLHRLKIRRIKTEYVREYFIPFRLSPERLHEIQKRIEPDGQTRLNSDFSPVAYYYDMMLWSRQFSAFSTALLANARHISFPKISGVLAIALLLLTIITRWKMPACSYQKFICMFSVTVMGFSSLGLELLMLFAFQALYGYVYFQLALIIAAFMCGMAIGGWLSLKSQIFFYDRKVFRLLALIHVLIAAVSFLLLISARLSLPDFWFQLFFILYGLIGGAVCGCEFPLVNSIYFNVIKTKPANAGILYAFDLAGALLGALTISAMIIPLYGLVNTMLLLALANSAVLTALALRRGG